VITHYGWRNEFLSVFPNAVALRAVAGSDAPKGTPWVNIIVLLALGVLLSAIWVRWRRFRRARIDPTLEGLQDNWEAAGDAVEVRRGRLRRWLKSWRD
jgi:membrane protein implicated in regulation of membrane protease activity